MNLVVYVSDALRTDHVGCYGARRVRTPTIDELAPSPQQSEARALKQSILGDLDRATPLVAPEVAKPTTVVEAKAICDHVDAEIDKLQSLVATAPRPEPTTPAESDLQP